MSIVFTVHRDRGFVLAEYSGSITDGLAREAWGGFMREHSDALDLHQLIDVSEADFSELTTGGMESFTRFMEGEYRKLGHVPSIKTAVYAPGDLPFGMSRMYGSMAVKTPELVQVFRERAAAEAWLGISTAS